MASVFTGFDTHDPWPAKMYSRTPTAPKGIIRMDPDCAVCHGPATLGCDCEAKGLEVAIKQAEGRMMQAIYNDIRKWVRGHAQDYILEYFRTLAERRKTAHSNHLDSITAQAWHIYGAPPHPKQLADAQTSLKRGIDEDWQASVDRYPEVLEYFFSLVELTLPADDEECITEPPLNAPPTANGNNGRKANRRSVPPEGHGPPQITMGGHGTGPPHAPAQIGPPPSAYGGGRGMRGDRGLREERDDGDEYARAYMPLSRESRRTPGPPQQQARPPPPTRRPSRRSMGGPQPPPAHAPYIEYAPY